MRGVVAATGALVLALLALASACDNFREPSDLRFARVLAVRAEPPAIPADGASRIDVLATSDDGVPHVLTPDELAVSEARPTDAGAPPIGVTIERDEAGYRVLAPPAATLAAIRTERGLAPDAPVPVVLAVTSKVGSSVKTAEKTVWVGGTGVNPVITALAIDGVAVDASATMARKGAHKLAVTAEGRAPLSFAWYSDVGNVDGYYQPEAQLTSLRPGRGVLLVVVRDPQGGVTWSHCAIEVVE